MRSPSLNLPTVLLGLALIVAPGARIAASAPATAEYRLKAVFLLQFAQFVRWPPQAAEGEFVVGILGDDPFGQVLEEALAGEVVRGRTVRIQRWREVRGVESCHVLFISASEADRLDEILAALEGRPILTVGDMPGFARAGGIIGFLVREDRIRFRINPYRARAAGLEISSRLLSLAELVDPPGERRAAE